MVYQMQEMTGERAHRILHSLLMELSEMDPSELTTFELNIIRWCATNPPNIKNGVEDRLTAK